MTNTASKIVNKYAENYYSIKDMNLETKSRVLEMISTTETDTKLKDILKARGVLNEMIDSLISSSEISDSFLDRLDAVKDFNYKVSRI